MNKSIKNYFWFRHFLACNMLANKAMQREEILLNLAKLILQEDSGVFANEQMTRYFWAADKTLCFLHASEEGQVFDNLQYESEDDGEAITLESLAQLTQEELDYYTEKYCFGKAKI